MSKDYIALFPGQGSQSLGMLGEGAFAATTTTTTTSEFAQLCAQLPADDVLQPVRAVRATTGVHRRDGPPAHPARRPRAEREHLHRPHCRQLGR